MQCVCGFTNHYKQIVLCWSLHVYYCTVLNVLPVVRHSHIVEYENDVSQLVSYVVVNSSLSLILFHEIYGYLEH